MSVASGRGIASRVCSEIRSHPRRASACVPKREKFADALGTGPPEESWEVLGKVGGHRLLRGGSKCSLRRRPVLS